MKYYYQDVSITGSTGHSPHWMRDAERNDYKNQRLRTNQVT